MEITIGSLIHGSSSAALPDFFTPSGPLAILSVTSDKSGLRHTWASALDKASVSPATFEWLIAELGHALIDPTLLSWTQVLSIPS
jgi:hypothetical protein